MGRAVKKSVGQTPRNKGPLAPAGCPVCAVVGPGFFTAPGLGGARLSRMVSWIDLLPLMDRGTPGRLANGRGLIEQ